MLSLFFLENIFLKFFLEIFEKENIWLRRPIKKLNQDQGLCPNFSVQNYLAFLEGTGLFVHPAWR